MKNLMFTVALVLGLASNASAKLIQHTDQIAEVQSTVFRGKEVYCS